MKKLITIIVLKKELNVVTTKIKGFFEKCLVDKYDIWAMVEHTENKPYVHNQKLRHKVARNKSDKNISLPTLPIQIVYPILMKKVPMARQQRLLEMEHYLKTSNLIRIHSSDLLTIGL